MTISKHPLAAVNLLVLAIIGSFQTPHLVAQTPDTQRNYAAFVEKMNATHKAPYVPYTGWDRLTPAEAKTLFKHMEGEDLSGLQEDLCPRFRCLNDQVNQDRNPYPKSVGGLAVDVTDPLNVVVASYDDRLGNAYTNDFIHVSTSGGFLWSDYETQLTNNAAEQIPKGVTIDRNGHTYVAVDSHDQNMDEVSGATDTAVKVQLDPNASVPNGLAPDVTVDMRHCTYDGLDDCNETLQTQGIRTDLSGSATDGTTYVFYSVFCQTSVPNCEGGRVPAGDSVMKVASSPGFGQEFSAPVIWSGAKQLNTGAGSMVIDSEGHAHLFYLDYTSSPQISLWESTDGVSQEAPILTFADTGLNNPKWSFKEDRILDCSGRGKKAFCAFAATQVGSKLAATTPNIYLAVINLVNGRTEVSRVNDDLAKKGKDHFNPSVASTSDGSIFVGWFDNRKDPNDLEVDYFVARSRDDGHTFSDQSRINKDSFDPTIGVVGLSGAIAGQGESTVKAVWTETHNGLTQQIRSAER